MYWGFESGTAEGWAGDPAGAGGITNITVSSSRAHTGTRSLAVTFSVGAYSSDNSTRGLTVAVPLCASNGTINLSGYRFSAWANFAVTAGTIPMNAANLLQGFMSVKDSPTRGTVDSLIPLSMSNVNTWLHMDGNINQVDAMNYQASVGIGFAIANQSSEGFSGIMYLDDVQVTPP
jgi:hypothetical protein